MSTSFDNESLLLSGMSVCACVRERGQSGLRGSNLVYSPPVYKKELESPPK